MGDSEDKAKDEGETKPKGPKLITVRIARAVDSYHHRGGVIQVPNDKYHQGLIKAGHLEKQEG